MVGDQPGRNRFSTGLRIVHARQVTVRLFAQWVRVRGTIRNVARYDWGLIILAAAPLPQVGERIEAVGAPWPELPFATRLHSAESR